MQNILSSAAKMVFILLTVTICIAFLFEVIKGNASFDPKDFIGLVGMAFAFYFAAKGDPDQPFAGK